MTRPPLATVDDVQARPPRPLTDGEVQRAAVLICDATSIAFARVPSVPSPAPPAAVHVVATAVLRALETPADGMRSETIGGYTRTAAHDGGGLYLTDDEIALLRPTEPPSDAFSVWTPPA